MGHGGRGGGGQRGMRTPGADALVFHGIQPAPAIHPSCGPRAAGRQTGSGCRLVATSMIRPSPRPPHLAFGLHLPAGVRAWQRRGTAPSLSLLPLAGSAAPLDRLPRNETTLQRKRNAAASHPFHSIIAAAVDYLGRQPTAIRLSGCRRHARTINIVVVLQ